MVASPLSYLQEDTLSLRAYRECRVVCFEDVKSRLTALQREWNGNTLNDCYNKAAVDKALDGVCTKGEILIRALPRFASDFLCMAQDDVVYVKEEKFIDWQDLITCLSPLLLVSSYIYREKGEEIDCSLQGVRSFFWKYIVPNFKHTAIARSRIIALDTFFDKTGGADDLHIHLNGITESDAEWQSLVTDTEKNIKALLCIDNGVKNAIKQMAEQSGVLFTDTLLLELVEKARKIRAQLFARVMGFKHFDITGLAESCTHPFSLIFDDRDAKCCSPHESLRYEALMIVLVLRHINKKHDERAADKLHEYLLIQGFFARLMVQETREKGFEQFQKKTQTNLSDASDKDYANKFMQLAGNDNSGVRYVEPRFSPKDSASQNMGTLRKVNIGWQQSNKCYPSCNSEDGRQCALVAHFIKKKKDKRDYFPYSVLRAELGRKASALISIKEAYRKELGGVFVAGIDAAASEFDTPPEVFAPAFRLLREKDFEHFTYHAGEDFYHLLSGLRAIYEAVEFCDLRRGDRIGHATAAGIDAAQWLSTVGEEILMPQGEYMDDLLFAHVFIREQNISSLLPLLNTLENEVTARYYEIYGNSEVFSDIVKAWQMRYIDPNKVDEADEKISSIVQKMIKTYNAIKCRKLYDKAANVKTSGIFGFEQLETLQKALLGYLHEKEIVIETMPTSNIRIGAHKSISTHQIFNWYKWYGSGEPLPPVVLGSDDPGVFATNIRNEYALLYCQLVYGMKWTRSDAMSLIKRLHENAEVYKFGFKEAS